LYTSFKNKKKKGRPGIETEESESSSTSVLSSSSSSSESDSSDSDDTEENLGEEALNDIAKHNDIVDSIHRQELPFDAMKAKFFMHETYGKKIHDKGAVLGGKDKVM
jgi:hypothetical protein